MTIRERAARASFFTRAMSVVGCLVLGLGLTAAFAEVVARTVFALSPLAYSRSMQPVFTSGDNFSPAVSRVDLQNARFGPRDMGYVPGGLAYMANPEAPTPHSATNVADFLFEHLLARYSAADVDRLLCDDPDAAALFVLGGSGAQGFSASRLLKSWHALLETDLRRTLAKDKLYVFNAAMGGHASQQERLAYYFAAAPRRGAVLIYNSYNDMLLSPAAAVRPGDSPWMGVWLGRIYGSPLTYWLAENSAIANKVLQDLINAEQTESLRRLGTDAAVSKTVPAAIDIYLENMSAVLDDCQAHGRACLVVLQPNRQLTLANRGDLQARHVAAMFDLLRKKIEASPYRDRFLDLTSVLDGDLARYTDDVHLDDGGQAAIEKALLPAVLREMRKPVPRDSSDSRCLLLAKPVRLATVPLKSLSPANNSVTRETDEGLDLKADARQWYWAATAMIDLDPAWAGAWVTFRVRLHVRKGELSVMAIDPESQLPVGYEKVARSSDGDALLDVDLHGYRKSVRLVFRKEMDDDVASEALIREIEILKR